MTNGKKPIYKTLLFWQILICSFVVIALSISIIGGISKKPTAAETEPPQTEAPTEAPTEQTQAQTEASTEAPTEPLIPENPYGPLDFKYEGEYLTCLAGEASLGIDVSTWQGDIDWQQVKDAGIEFAMIRVGYRGTEHGTLGMDSYAQINYDGAIAAGVKVGVYFFSQAINEEEAREEAAYLLDAIKAWDIQMPVVYDWEYVDEDARTGDMDARTLTDCSIAFCEEIEKAGYEPMIYFNTDQGHEQMIMEELVQYGFWLAMYDHVMDYPYQIDMWQYTSSGTVPGIDGNVDMNLYFTY